MFSWGQGRFGEGLVTPSGQVHSPREAGPQREPSIDKRGGPYSRQGKGLGRRPGQLLWLPQVGQVMGDFLRSCASREVTLVSLVPASKAAFPHRGLEVETPALEPSGKGEFCPS